VTLLNFRSAFVDMDNCIPINLAVN